MVGAIVVCGLAALLGWVLSLATTRVVNWFVMTDELFYERLGISVAHSGSVVPRFRGETVGNVNQLYPSCFRCCSVMAMLVRVSWPRTV